MNKIFTLLALLTITGPAFAQTVSPVQPYGKIDQADLELKSCDFEKDANAEVLFEKGVLYYGVDLSNIMLDVHRRIKIFNDNGKSSADVRIEYIGNSHFEYITGIQAQTINLVDGKVEITKLDKKSIYTKSIDKENNVVTFTFPNVKAGSVLEYKYTFNISYNRYIPTWFFQDKIPVKYSELDTSIPDVFNFRPQPHFYQAMVKNTSKTDGRSYQDTWKDSEGHSQVDSYPYNEETNERALVNIPSLPDEPYMSSFNDNVQCIHFQLISIRPIGGFARIGNDTWAKVAGSLVDDDDFGGQFNRKLKDEDVIISKAKALGVEDRIAFIFNEVKNSMKWNEHDSWYTIDGTARAWENKTGNSTEINLILYHLLKESGITAYPMVISTREHGKVRPYYTSAAQFNRAVVYAPVDSNKKLVLDASGKYNSYNETPRELLNSSGLYVNKAKKSYDIIFIKKDEPVRQAVLINAEIKPGGKLEGTVQVSSSSYARARAIEFYKRDGEKKYIDYLRDNDNSLSISSLTFNNMEVDTLPLLQKADFRMDMAGSDENYIYLNPNLFTSLKKNLFVGETRMTDIDFGYLQNFSVNGVYKIPAGYKLDAIPKNVSMVMPDKSITFKRLIAEQDGSLIVRYNIIYNKVQYFKEEYADFREFYKKMYEMLNEQVVLKKS